MTLSEILEKIRNFDEESFICVEGGPYPSPSANAVVIPINVGDQAPAPAGTEYFIEVYRAVEVITAWSQHRGGRIPTVVEMIHAIYYFRKHNAYVLPESTRGRRRPRSRNVVIAWFGAASALIGCFISLVIDWTDRRSAIFGPLSDAGLGFLLDAALIVDDIGLIKMTLGFFICGVLAGVMVATRFTARKVS